jgi:hypothetical protein
MSKPTAKLRPRQHVQTPSLQHLLTWTLASRPQQSTVLQQPPSRSTTGVGLLILTFSLYLSVLCNLGASNSLCP